MHLYLGYFGLGKIMTGTRVFGHSTMQAGTPGFQSPEQLCGEDISPNCDIYVLKALLTELFGAKPLWPKLSNHTIIYNVAHLKQMPKFDHIPHDVQDIVKLCVCPVGTRVCVQPGFWGWCVNYIELCCNVNYIELCCNVNSMKVCCNHI